MASRCKERGCWFTAATRTKGARAVEELKSAQRQSGDRVPASGFQLVADVRRLAATVLERTPRIDVLVNNAGSIFVKRALSKDGYEMTFAVNHLAPFLLTHLLLDALKSAGRRASSRQPRVRIGERRSRSTICR